MNSVVYCMEKLNKNSKLRQMDDYIQHGSTSCLKHTIAVAYYSIKLADRLGIKYKKASLSEARFCTIIFSTTGTMATAEVYTALRTQARR